MRARTRPLLVLPVTALLLSGCAGGGSAQPAGTTSPAASTETTAPAETPTDSASTPASPLPTPLPFNPAAEPTPPGLPESFGAYRVNAVLGASPTMANYEHPDDDTVRDGLVVELTTETPYTVDMEGYVQGQVRCHPAVSVGGGTACVVPLRDGYLQVRSNKTPEELAPLVQQLYDAL